MISWFLLQFSSERSNFANKSKSAHTIWNGNDIESSMSENHIDMQISLILYLICTCGKILYAVGLPSRPAEYLNIMPVENKITW